MGAETRAQLCQLLEPRLEELADRCLHNVHRVGAELKGVGSNGAVWVIGQRGAKRGLTCNTADPGSGGDLFALVMHNLFAGDYRPTYPWIRQWLGLDQGFRDETPEQRRARWKDAERSRGQRALQAIEEAQQRRKAAFARYVRATKDIAGTPVEAYLAGRGLEVDLKAHVGTCLRYSPAEFHSPDVGELPAMLAPIVDPNTQRFLALHVTYLERRPSGWAKTTEEPAKKVFGPKLGGIIPLARGASGKPTAQGLDGEKIIIAEGIENALSAFVLDNRKLRTWASVDVGNLAEINIPAWCRKILMVLDRDGVNDSVMHARFRATDRWKGEQRDISYMKPREKLKDMNEQLQWEIAHADDGRRTMEAYDALMAERKRRGRQVAHGQG